MAPLIVGSEAAPAATSTPGAAITAKPGGIVSMRRLTESQYRNAIADIFGADIKIGGRFDPILRADQGLVAVGAAQSAVSPSGFEQFDAMARTIAAQVLEEQRRGTFLTCKPADPKQADAACASRFYSTLGTYIFRRPLTEQEIGFYADLATRGAAPTHDFYAGLQLGLAAMLVAPQFLYQIETLGADGRQLDGYSKASRLSFLLWNSVPDDALLQAAQHDLETPDGLRKQVDRMLGSPKAEQGARAFFTDFLQLDRVSDLSKDTVVYDRFSAEVSHDLTEQTLRTVVDLLITNDRPYPEIFTSRRTFLTRKLGLLYHEPVAASDGWTAYDQPDADGRTGILGQGSFLALFSHEGRSSPTLRGRAIREVLLCQPVPNPPANVDFSGFNDAHNAVLKTARQRLARHATDPVCASCHKITDPLGLPLERFDGVGAARKTENDTAIDVTGIFEGKPFDGAAALGQLLSQSKAPNECVTKRVAEYATGNDEDHLPNGWVDMLGKNFETSGYRFRTLLRDVALSPQFYNHSAPGAASNAVADASTNKR